MGILDGLRLRRDFERGRRELDNGNLEAAVRTLEEYVTEDDANPGAWWNLGLAYKFQRNWAESMRCNRRYIELRPKDEEGYFNFGVAASALRDWPAARWAWRGIGLEVDDGDGPPDLELGPTPVRLNASSDGGGEVVWANRLDPCRAIIRSVPTPESGHRFGDVILHDVVPRGQREAGGYTFSVFDELIRMDPSDLATHTAMATAPGEADVDALIEQGVAAGLGVEDWTSSIQFICASCSLAEAHRHDEPTGAPVWEPDRRLGLAGETGQLRELLDRWSAAGSGRAFRDLESSDGNATAK